MTFVLAEGGEVVGVSEHQRNIYGHLFLYVLPFPGTEKL